MSDATPQIYHCSTCGNTLLCIDRQYVRRQYVTSIVACTCGAGHSIAAHRITYTDHVVTERGDVNDEHRIEWDSSDTDEEELIEEEESFEVFCHTCMQARNEPDWVLVDKVEEHTTETLDEEYVVKCGGCGREIEFGWSHPERGGRVWPAECSDFNPWTCWPEPRYVESWRAKGWLRPDRCPKCLSVKQIAGE
jgi:hypothetical protein